MAHVLLSVHSRVILLAPARLSASMAYDLPYGSACHAACWLQRLSLISTFPGHKLYNTNAVTAATPAILPLTCLSPCSSTSLPGTLVLMTMYGYCLLQGANVLSDGSEMLLEVLDPGLIGGGHSGSEPDLWGPHEMKTIPCLGSVPVATGTRLWSLMVLAALGLSPSNRPECRMHRMHSGEDVAWPVPYA